MLALLVLVPPSMAATVTLKPETVQAWDEYIRIADARIQRRLDPGATFLRIDEEPALAAKARKKGMVVFPAVPHIPRKVPSGLIHDWIAAAFLPNVTIQDVLPIVRNYGRYKEFYHPNVIESRAIETGGSLDRFSIVLMNRALFSKIALDSDYEASYVRVDEKRMYSVSRTTRIREIAEYGLAGQHTLPEDEGTGLIWRLYSALRFEERDGGLYIEVEAIALSRDIPAAVRWAAEPIVRRVSRDSLTTALHQTEDAVHSAAAASAKRPLPARPESAFTSAFH